MRYLIISRSQFDQLHLASISRIIARMKLLAITVVKWPTPSQNARLRVFRQKW